MQKKSCILDLVNRHSGTFVFISSDAFITRCGDNAVEEAFCRGDGGSGRGEDA